MFSTHSIFTTRCFIFIPRLIISVSLFTSVSFKGNTLKTTAPDDWFCQRIQRLVLLYQLPGVQQQHTFCCSLMVLIKSALHNNLLDSWTKVQASAKQWLVHLCFSNVHTDGTTYWGCLLGGENIAWGSCRNREIWDSPSKYAHH